MLNGCQVVDLISVLNKSAWYKDFIPVGCVVLGVILGVFANSVKDVYFNYRSRKEYAKLIQEELQIALTTSVDLVKKLCKAIDEAKENKSAPYVYLDGISDLCFSEFYPKIIKFYSSSERKEVNLAYFHIKKINQTQIEFIFSGEITEADFRGNTLKLNDILIFSMKLHNAYDSIYNQSLGQIASVGAFLRLNGIESVFYKDLAKLAKEIEAEKKG